MLEDLGSYALSDFLLFSQDTYFRLFELYNLAIFPLHVLFVVIGGLALYLLRVRGASAARVAWFLAALLWGWVAWAFHLERYAEINLAASYFAGLFALTAVLLLGVGTVAGALRPAEAPAPVAGMAIVAYAILLHPLTGLLSGRTWTELAYFGAAPDPTAIGTLGLLLLTGGPWRWLLLLPALLWCVVSVLTAYAMGSIEAVAPAVSAAVVLLLSFRKTFRGPSE